jgi:hypothetical protein
MLDTARLEVATAARRLDVITSGMQQDARGLSRSAHRISPKLLLGGGLALGLVAVLVPSSLRTTALLGLGRFVMERLLGSVLGGLR